MSDYTPTGKPLIGSRGVSGVIRDEFNLIKDAIVTKADSASATFTVINVPTQSPNDNSTKAASTAYVDAVDALKANIDSPALTGIPTAPTASGGTSTTQLATTAFVISEGLSGSLPGQTGNAGKLIQTDGTTATWEPDLNASIIKLVDGSDSTKKAVFDLSFIDTGSTRTFVLPNASATLVGTLTSQGLINKTYFADDSKFLLQDADSITRKARFDLGNITAGNTRVITLPDKDVTLDNQQYVNLGEFSFSAASLAQIETDWSSYKYIKVYTNDLTLSSNGDINLRLKVNSAYKTSGYNYAISEIRAGSGSGFLYQDSSSSFIPVINNIYAGVPCFAEFDVNTSSEHGYAKIKFNSCFRSSAYVLASEVGSGGLNTSGDYITEGVLLYPDSGTFSGTITVVGVK